MGFFHRLGDALSRFLYGRNGADQLGMATLLLGIIVDVVNIFVKTVAVRRVLSALTALLLFILLFRMLSKNLAKRRAENAWFLRRCYYPIKRLFGSVKQRSRDREHKYFTCPQCRTVCRVPRGKGKIVITCPKCRTEIRGKS